MNKNTTLSVTTIVFHWLVALLMIITTTLGLIIMQMDKSPSEKMLMDTHKAFGVLVLALAILRIVWRLKEGPIVGIAAMPKWQAISAVSVHHLLLLASVAMPISGLMISIGLGYPVKFFGLDFIAPSQDKIAWLSEFGYFLHGIGKYAIVTLIAVHVLGALKHQLVDKDGTISRMLGKNVANH